MPVAMITFVNENGQRQFREFVNIDHSKITLTRLEIKFSILISLIIQLVKIKRGVMAQAPLW